MGVLEILLYPDETLSQKENAKLAAADPTVDQVLQDLADTLDAYRVREGCLSVPEYTGNVTHYRQAVVKG